MSRMAEYAMDMEEDDDLARCTQDHQLMQEEEERRFWAEQEAMAKLDPGQFWSEFTESVGKAVRGMK